MAKEYLPDSYLRKRQRDARLRRMRDLGAIVLIMAAAIISGYFIYNRLILPKRSAAGAGVTEEMAQQRQDLSDRQQVAEPNTSTLNGGSNNAAGQQQLIPAMADADLSTLNYTSSFPLINVSVEAGASGDQRVKAELPAEAEKPTEQTLAEDAVAAEKPAEQKPTATDEKKDGQPKPKDNKPEDKPVTDKPVEKPADKPAETKPAANTSSSSVVYKVYAGAHNSQADAEKQVKDLAAIGLNGKVIESKPNYLVYVGSFSKFEEAEALRDRLKSSGFSAFASKTKK
jgi:cell division septation protein DedD